MAEPKKATEVELVTMQGDGRKVEFAGKRKMMKDALVGDDGSIAVRVDWRNGISRTYPLKSDMLAKFAGHGAEQKYGDEAAGLEDIDDQIEALDALHVRLYDKGEWKTTREASGMAGASVLLKALVQFSGKTVDEVRAFLADKTPGQKQALRQDESIKPIVEAIEAEKAKGKEAVDTKGLLAGLA